MLDVRGSDLGSHLQRRPIKQFLTWWPASANNYVAPAHLQVPHQGLEHRPWEEQSTYAMSWRLGSLTHLGQHLVYPPPDLWMGHDEQAAGGVLLQDIRQGRHQSMEHPAILAF